jgi:ATP-dependent protease ClpP protease subunit
MKNGVINIIGQIGSYKDSKGEIKQGVELVDVMTQVAAAGKVDGYVVLINSHGGRVSVGNEIGDYLKTLNNLSTVIYQQSASIATRPSLSAPKGKRFIIKGAKFFIHNPWTRIEGDAGELMATAEELQNAENELVNFYAENSNLNKEGIILLMKKQTSLTDDQAISFGFADKIITEEEAKGMGLELIGQEQSEILALVEPKNENNMSKEAKSVLKSITDFMAKLNIKVAEAPKVKNLELKSNDGKILSFQTEDKEIKIGDMVSCEGKLISEKEIVLADGRTVKVNEKSEIMEIKPSETEQKIDAAEYAKLKAENEELKNKILIASQEKEENDKVLLAVKTNFEILAKKVTSTYEPENEVQGFRRNGNEDEEDAGVLAAQKRMKDARARKNKQTATT